VRQARREGARRHALTLSAAAVLGLALAWLAGVRWCGPLFATPAPLDALWSPRGGLLYWNPVLWLAVAGLGIRVCRDARGVLALAAPLVALALWPHASYDLARSIPILPLCAAPIAWLLTLVERSTRERPHRTLGVGGAVLCLWNAGMMAQYADPSFPRDASVSFVDLAAGHARVLTRLAGAPLTWPASWLFACRTGLHPARYEQLAGRVLFDRPDALGGVLDIGDDLSREEILLGSGWGVRHECGVGLCRAVEGRAEVFVPLTRSRTVDITVRAEGAGTLRVLQGERELAQLTLAAQVGDLRLEGVVLSRGVTTLTLAPTPGSSARVERVVLTPLDR
jgi:hypothetical protein